MAPIAHRPRSTNLLRLALGVLLATANGAGAVESRTCEQAVGRPGVASGAVVLSRPEGSALLPASSGEASFTLLGNRRLRFTRTYALVAADRLPAADLELALEAAGTVLASGDWCSGITGLVSRPLAGDALARVLGLSARAADAGRPRLVLRVRGTSTVLLAGTPGEVAFAPRGCGKVCAPALTAVCRSSCEGQQPNGRCIRQCRRAGLQACRSTGSCRTP
jgi:hypothetical protein